MFDMSWGEVMLIGGVALIVIGPKDLPKALRTVGQVTRKMRRMAGEFQSQFNEAVREAELDEVRNQVDGIKRQATTMGPIFNPVQTIRDEIKGAVEGRPAQSSTQPLANVAAQLAADEASGPAARASGEDTTPGASDDPAQPPADPPHPVSEPVKVGAAGV